MPTKVIAAHNIEVGKKGGGKHWTTAEQAERLAAEASISIDKPIGRVPAWLNEDARKIWRRIRRQTQGIELLTEIDENLLAQYCDLTVKYRDLSTGPGLDDEGIKSLQAYARLLANYAEKLGLTPGGRARLAKKRADETLDAFQQEFV